MGIRISDNQAVGIRISGYQGDSIPDFLHPDIQILW